MYIIEKTSHFDKWLKKLKDKSARAKILIRIQRIECGNLGDFKKIDNELNELRFFQGPGYRIYFAHKGNRIILLINGGDKSSQSNDIQKAKEILLDCRGNYEN